jgi:hypothetical protein
VDALTAAYHHTNPVSKWRSRLVDRLPPDWEQDLAIRPSGLSAAERVWRLHRAPKFPHSVPAVRHALDITSFSRTVFVAAERRLLACWPPHIGEPVNWDGVHRQPDDVVLPFLDFDVDYAATPDVEGSVVIGRLNEFGRSLRLLPHEFAWLLLFDGVTTAGEVTDGIRDAGTATSVRELVRRVRDADLAFSLRAD